MSTVYAYKVRCTRNLGRPDANANSLPAPSRRGGLDCRHHRPAIPGLRPAPPRGRPRPRGQRRPQQVEQAEIETVPDMDRGAGNDHDGPVREQRRGGHDQRHEQLPGGQPARQIRRLAPWEDLLPAVNDRDLQALHAAQQQEYCDRAHRGDRRGEGAVRDQVHGARHPEVGQQPPPHEQHHAEGHPQPTARLRGWPRAGGGRAGGAADGLERGVIACSFPARRSAHAYAASPQPSLLLGQRCRAVLASPRL